MFIITSDHGQQLGEQGYAYHGCGVTDAVARVPLVLVDPESRYPNWDASRWVSLTELYKWILDRVDPNNAPDAQAEPVVSEGPDLTRLNVFIDGDPASGLNPLAAGLGGPSTRWNHGLVGAYNPDGKYLLDLDEVRVFYWPTNLDPDTSSPTEIGLPDISRAIARVLGPRASRVSVGSPTRQRESSPEAAVSERLNLWGYT